MHEGGLKALGEFIVDGLGFAAPDVDGGFEAGFDVVREGDEDGGEEEAEQSEREAAAGGTGWWRAAGRESAGHERAGQERPRGSAAESKSGGGAVLAMGAAMGDEAGRAAL